MARALTVSDSNRSATVLIVDDSDAFRETAILRLKAKSYHAIGASSTAEARECLKHEFVDLLVLDERLETATGTDSGIAFLKSVHTQHPELKGIVVTANAADVPTAVAAMRAGALDFVESTPNRFTWDKLVESVRQALATSEWSRAQRFAQWHGKVPHIEWRSDVMGRLIDKVKKVAPTNTVVLITGPSGSGKELIAETIMGLSRRSGEPFVKVNCAAVAEDLIESELFGHEKGAFTGATEKKVGMFEQANGGTIFLDEVGDMSAKAQAKVLRALQEGEVRPVGSAQTKKVNVRVIAATNKNLEDEIKNGRFRDDLHFRLNVYPIFVPPLRERPDDIEPLVNYFLAEYRKLESQSVTLGEGCFEMMRRYSWPGNVRQLRSAVWRGAIDAIDGLITAQDLGEILGAAKEARNNSNYSLDWATAEYEFNRRYWNHVMGVAAKSKMKAKDIAGVDRATVYKHLDAIAIQDGVEDAVERHLTSLTEDERAERLEAARKALHERKEWKLSEDELTEEQWRDIATAHLRRQVAKELNLKSADE